MLRKYVCIYNEETREIEGVDEYDTEYAAGERAAQLAVECYARGGTAWKVHLGDAPFAFPVPAPEAEA